MPITPLAVDESPLLTSGNNRGVIPDSPRIIGIPENSVSSYGMSRGDWLRIKRETKISWEISSPLTLQIHARPNPSGRRQLQVEKFGVDVRRRALTTDVLTRL
jgi:hypothetical protein